MGAEQETARLTAENDRLRGLLAAGSDPCVYCRLAKADMAKCKSGFPGCARADDISVAGLWDAPPPGPEVMVVAAPFPPVAVRAADQWFVSNDEEFWHPCGPLTREEAIRFGREMFLGASFQIGAGQFEGLRRDFFDRGDLYQLIDEGYEESAFEDTFSEEAEIDDATINELVDALNKAWNAWVAKHDPRSRALNHLHSVERIPADDRSAPAPEAQP